LVFDFLRRNWRQTIELENAYLYPLTRGSSPETVEGGVWHPDLPNSFHHVSHLDRAAQGTAKEWLERQEPPKTSMSGHGLYAGPFFAHYGHFVAECIHRLWAWHEEPGKFDYIASFPAIRHPRFQPANPQSLFDFQRPVLEYLAIPIEKLLPIQEAVIAEHITVPAQASILGQRGARARGYTGYMAERGARFFAGYQPKNAAPPERIYVSRSSYLTTGSFAGERYIEQLLADEGFHVMRPEAMPLAEQLHYYRNAKQLIFAEGSAIHTTELLGTLKAEVAILLRRRHSYKQWIPLVNKRCKRLKIFAKCDQLPSLAINKNGEDVTPTALTIVDAPALAGFLRQNGFAKLPTFSPSGFWQMEAADIARYLVTLNLRHTFEQDATTEKLKAFRKALAANENPYLSNTPL
jgi:hypothetical protein